MAPEQLRRACRPGGEPRTWCSRRLGTLARGQPAARTTPSIRVELRPDSCASARERTSSRHHAAAGGVIETRHRRCSGRIVDGVRGRPDPAIRPVGRPLAATRTFGLAGPRSGPDGGDEGRGRCDPPLAITLNRRPAGPPSAGRLSQCRDFATSPRMAAPAAPTVRRAARRSRRRQVRASDRGSRSRVACGAGLIRLATQARRSVTGVGAERCATAAAVEATGPAAGAGPGPVEDHVLRGRQSPCSGSTRARTRRCQRRGPLRVDRDWRSPGRPRPTSMQGASGRRVSRLQRLPAAGRGRASETHGPPGGQLLGGQHAPPRASRAGRRNRSTLGLAGRSLRRASGPR